MARFSYYTANKLREIFKDHCNLTVEQYAVISDRLEELVGFYQDERPEEETEKKEDELLVIFCFLTDSKELTREEFIDLLTMLEEMKEQAKRIRTELIRKAITEGTVL